MERFGLMARFGFMHLVATNLCLWIRTIIWESANEWIHHIYRQKVAAASRTAINGPYAPEVASTPISERGPIALGLRSSQSGYDIYKSIFPDFKYIHILLPTSIHASTGLGTETVSLSLFRF